MRLRIDLKLIASLLCCAGLITACATTSTRPAVVSISGKEGPGLVGTWRVVRYEVWDSGNVLTPFGNPPSGYAVFDATRHAFVQLMHPESHEFRAYYGTYHVAETASVVTIAVEGGNIPDYAGTRQVRPFRIAGDTLRLGIPGQYQATLIRVK